MAARFFRFAHSSTSSEMPGSFMQSDPSETQGSSEELQGTEPIGTSTALASVRSPTTYPPSPNPLSINIPLPTNPTSKPASTLPRSRSPSSSDNEGKSSSVVQPGAKIRLVETPSIYMDAMRRQLQEEKTKAATSELQLQRVRKRVRRNLEEREATTNIQLMQSNAIWALKAAEYEQRLQIQQNEIAAQESRLQMMSAKYETRDTELRHTLTDRLQQLTSLQLSLQERDASIGDIGILCRDLSAKLEAVQDQLRTEKERQSAERERELLALEAKMTAHIQTLSKTLPQSPSAQSISSTPSTPRPKAALRRQLSPSPMRSPTPMVSSDSPSDYPLELPSPSPSQQRSPATLPPLQPTSSRQRARDKATKNTVAGEKRKFKQSKDRNFHLGQVRRLFDEIFDAPEDKDFISSHVAASQDLVEAYLDGAGAGPDRNDLHFSHQSPYNNAWNRAICSYLGQILWKRQQTERWQSPGGQLVATASEAYWEDAILEKFKRIRTSWNDAQGRAIRDDSTGQRRLESRSEIQMRQFNAGENELAESRQQERRRKRWERRRDVCQSKIRFATIPFEKNRWNQFLKIVETLGRDGMSSDESATEEVTHRPYYRVSVLLWRRDFDAIMETIDAARLGPQSGYSNRGSLPTVRHRQDRELAHLRGQSVVADNITISRRPPTLNLPLTFYDEKWLARKSREYIEQVLCIAEGYEWV